MSSQSRGMYLVGASLMLTCALLVSACEEKTGPDENQDICKTHVAGGSSPAPGALTLDGQFYAGETVILEKVNSSGQNQDFSGTPATDRGTFTLTGLPSGTNTYTVIISCEAGRENNGSRSFIVQ